MKPDIVSIPSDYMALITELQLKNKELLAENNRMKHFLPDSYTEMRLREKQLQDRMSRYEQSIIDYENEKKALIEQLKQKDRDVVFLKAKFEETNTLWHQENLEKQKLEAIIGQQYREAMELDTLRRRAEDDKNQFRLKNNQLKTEIEDLLKENRKVATEKMTLSNRLESLRKLNKQMEKKVETMEQKPGAQKFAKQLELQEKLSFTVQKFEEQN